VKHAQNVRRSRTFMLVNQFATIALVSLAVALSSQPASPCALPGEGEMLHLTRGEP